MKIDMHCHVRQGSVDSRVTLEAYIELLMERGIQGMLITDHDTYNGFRYWKKNIKDKRFTDFVVLKGIEYDTLDAGHILVIMPQGVKKRLLEVRGLPVSRLIDFVHQQGGICGPAHPCGAKFMSLQNSRGYRKMPEIMKRFDFVETFNACESEESNAKALELAKLYGKPGTGGSDAHKPECVGRGYTELDVPIQTELDLIQAIREKVPMKAEGEYYRKTTKEKMGPLKGIWAYSFWLYNKSGALLHWKKRREKIKDEHPLDPIDPIDIPFLK